MRMKVGMLLKIICKRERSSIKKSVLILMAVVFKERMEMEKLQGIEKDKEINCNVVVVIAISIMLI